MNREQPKPTKLFIGTNVKMLELDRELRLVARTREPVLILGETGVGKDVVASEVHERSPRAGKELVVANCASLSTELADSQLFGHERGAFTGATNSYSGMIREANASSIFLDEIGSLSMTVQGKLLRVFEDPRVRSVGGKVVQIDVRFIAATNADVDVLVEQHEWRDDFLARFRYRLLVPPLRERLEDLEALARHFIELDRNDDGHNTHATTLTSKALDLLRSHAWPRNVRELRGAIDDALMRSKDEGCAELDVRHFQIKVQAATQQPTSAARNARAAIATLAKSILDELCAGRMERAKIPDIAKRHRELSLKFHLAEAFFARFKGAERKVKADELFKYRSDESIRYFLIGDEDDPDDSIS